MKNFSEIAWKQPELGIFSSKICSNYSPFCSFLKKLQTYFFSPIFFEVLKIFNGKNKQNKQKMKKKGFEGLLEQN